MRLFLIYLAGALIGLVMSAFAFAGLPDLVPVHWGASGQPDRYGSKWEAALTMPIVLVFLGIIFALAPRFSRTSFTTKTIKGLEVVSIGTCVFMLGIHYVMISNKPASMMVILPILLAGLTVLMGFSVKNIDRNPVMGIRVPWTMKSDAAWRRAHDSASKLWIFGGLGLLALSLFVTNPMVPIFGFVVLLLLPIATSYYTVRSM